MASDGSRIFLEAGNLTDILRQISLIGMISLAMTFVILTGGIDLSVGSILALSTALTAMFLTRAWSSCVVRQPHGYGDCRGGRGRRARRCGKRRGHRDIRGAAVHRDAGVDDRAARLREVAHQQREYRHRLRPGCGSRGSRKCSGRRRSSSERYAGAAAVFWMLLDRTVFGRHVRAIGDNEKAAEYAGLPIRRTKVWVYSLTGLLSGIAGVLYAAENHQGNPNAGVAYELDAIAAVVIGGTRLSGGKGSISGTIVGTLIMGVLTNMLRLNNVDSNVEMMIKAVIIVLAVAVQRERNG